MIKVSFKKDYKKVEVEGNTTVVVLEGDFVSSEDANSPNPTLMAAGFAKRSPEDEDNPVLAERIAEARAKMKIYRKTYKAIGDTIEGIYRPLNGKSFLKTHRKDTPAIVEVLHRNTKGMLKDYFKHRLLYNKELKHLKKLINGTGNTGTGKS